MGQYNIGNEFEYGYYKINCFFTWLSNYVIVFAFVFIRWEMVNMGIHVSLIELKRHNIWFGRRSLLQPKATAFLRGRQISPKLELFFTLF